MGIISKIKVLSKIDDAHKFAYLEADPVHKLLHAASALHHNMVHWHSADKATHHEHHYSVVRGVAAHPLPPNVASKSRQYLPIDHAHGPTWSHTHENLIKQGFKHVAHDGPEHHAIYTKGQDRVAITLGGWNGPHRNKAPGDAPHGDFVADKPDHRRVHSAIYLRKKEMIPVHSADDDSKARHNNPNLLKFDNTHNVLNQHMHLGETKLDEGRYQHHYSIDKHETGPTWEHLHNRLTGLGYRHCRPRGDYNGMAIYNKGANGKKVVTLDFADTPEGRAPNAGEHPEKIEVVHATYFRDKQGKARGKKA